MADNSARLRVIRLERRLGEAIGRFDRQLAETAALTAALRERQASHLARLVASVAAPGYVVADPANAVTAAEIARLDDRALVLRDVLAELRRASAP